MVPKVPKVPEEWPGLKIVLKTTFNKDKLTLNFDMFQSIMNIKKGKTFWNYVT
jgi:hypothetical protein